MAGDPREYGVVMAPIVRRVEQYSGKITAPVRSEAEYFVLELDHLKELETRLAELEAENQELRKSRPPE